MRKRTTLAFSDVGTMKGCTTIADLKLRVAEYIIAQHDCYGATDVRTILAETKVGAWRRPTLMKIL